MWSRSRRTAGAVFLLPVTTSSLPVTSTVSSHSARLSTSLMPSPRRSRAAFESSAPPSAVSSSPSPAPLPQPSKRRRVKESATSSHAMSSPSSSSSTSALPPASELMVDSPLLSSHLSAFLSSVASAERPQRCASLWPLFEAKRGRLVGLSLASHRHSLYVDLSSASSDSAPLLPPALQSLLLSSPPQSAAHSRFRAPPPPPPSPAWPLLLPFPSSVRLLRRALMKQGEGATPNVSLSPQLRCLTPRVDRLCALTPALPALPPLPSALEPPSHVPSASPLSAEQRQRLSSYHSSLLSRYSRAFSVGERLGGEVQRGMAGLSEFRCSYAPLLLSDRNHRWAVDGEQRAAPLPLLRRPSSHHVEVVEVGEDPTSALQTLRLSAPAPAVLGFDTESRPSTVAGQPMNSPSLVQLSSHTFAVLVRVDPRSGLPPPLVALLVDSAYTKVGQGSHADVQQLVDHYRQLPAELSSSPASFGFLDLTALSSPLRLDRPGLQGLVSGLMGHRLSKGQQMSNWASSLRLTGAQVEYAALDALVSLQLKERLEAVNRRLTDLVTGWALREGVDVQALSSEDLPVLPVPPTSHKV